MADDGYDDDLDDDIPLHHKKPFGSGLRRNEIKFVPASSDDPSIAASSSSNNPGALSNGQSVSNFYLSMVLKKPDAESSTKAPPPSNATNAQLCDVCKTPLAARTHDASIAHQVCLAHSHPPSALDRSRMGLGVLAAHGWDPDSRTGLGAAGQGVQYPVKATPKEDRLGIGVVVPKSEALRRREEDKPRLLDAKRVRKMAAQDRRKTDRLQQQIFGRVDLERYLGPA